MERPPRTVYQHVVLNNIDYSVGDSVCVNEYNDDMSYAKIIEFCRSNSTDDDTVLVEWYFKPTDVFKNDVHGVPVFISKSELFESNDQQRIPIQTIYDKIRVLPFGEYFAFDEVESDVFFTRCRYDPIQKTFRPAFSKWRRTCVCDTIINPDWEYIICEMCERCFHQKCIDMADEENWVCMQCRRQPD